ncbi:hypothetical protein ACS0TY_029509 [Phlomoides rotata]
MEKRKARESCELALAKSAAWAWLEHYSGGSDEQKTPESDVSRTKFNPKPSRYKLEAMKRSSNSTHTISASASLLDRYEIERISRQLDFCLKPSGRRAAEDIPAAAHKKKMSKGGIRGSRRRPENGRVDVVEVGCRPWQGIRT